MVEPYEMVIYVKNGWGFMRVNLIIANIFEHLICVLSSWINSLLMLLTQLGEYSNYLPLINETLEAQRSNRPKVTHPRHKARAPAQDVCFITSNLSLYFESREAGAPGEVWRVWDETCMFCRHLLDQLKVKWLLRRSDSLLQMVILKLSHLCP